MTALVGQTFLVQITVPFIQLHLLHPSEDLNVELLGCLAPPYMQPRIWPVLLSLTQRACPFLTVQFALGPQLALAQGFVPTVEFGCIQTRPQPLLQHFCEPLHPWSLLHEFTQIPEDPGAGLGHCPGFCWGFVL